ncbi:MAG: PaaI family thioesterase [Bacillota bacterium]
MAEERYAMCFGCGEDNRIGLKLKFDWEGDWLATTFTPGEVHQGYPGVCHGGIVATVLDEVMAQVLFTRGIPAVTAKLEVRYSHAVPAGRPTVYRARLVRDARRLYEIEAEALSPTGKPYATAKASYLPIAKEDIKNINDQG